MDKSQPWPTVIYLDKPTGLTSFDIIRRLRRYFKTDCGRVPKMGHAGTLDPLATGLLIIGLDSGTKELSTWLGRDKEYLADILLGTKTDTGDITGRIEKQDTIPADLSESGVKKAVMELVGDHQLSVPRYSAVKQAGQPLYRAVRAGQMVKTPKRSMTVKEADLLKLQTTSAGVILKVRLVVASGVYIRSVAEFLAEQLGTVGTVQALRRTRVGPVDINQAVKLETIDRGDTRLSKPHS